MDLRGGQCVVAVGGNRRHYRPVAEFAARRVDGNPIELARCFASYGYSRVYVADLDALQTGRIQTAALKRLADHWSRTGALSELWLDVGDPSADACLKPIFDGLPVRWIHATESLQTVESFRDSVRRAASRWPRESVIISMDFRDSQFLGSDEPAWWNEIERHRWPTIVLDLARVGSSQGGDVRLIHQLRHRLGDELTLITGGGVRDLGDVDSLLDAGWDAVLVATALQRLVPILEPFDRDG